MFAKENSKVLLYFFLKCPHGILETSFGGPITNTDCYIEMY